MFNVKILKKISLNKGTIDWSCSVLVTGRIGQKFQLSSVLCPSLLGSFRDDYTYKNGPLFSLDAKEMLNPRKYFMLMDDATQNL